MSKPKFDKKKCLKCKYHGTGEGYSVRLKNGDTIKIHCNYTNAERGSCLRPLSNTETYDIRGEDYNNCLLFVEGVYNRKK